MGSNRSLLDAPRNHLRQFFKEILRCKSDRYTFLHQMLSTKFYVIFPKIGCLTLTVTLGRDMATVNFDVLRACSANFVLTPRTKWVPVVSKIKCKKSKNGKVEFFSLISANVIYSLVEGIRFATAVVACMIANLLKDNALERNSRPM